MPQPLHAHHLPPAARHSQPLPWRPDFSALAHPPSHLPCLLFLLKPSTPRARPAKACWRPTPPRPRAANCAHRRWCRWPCSRWMRARPQAPARTGASACSRARPSAPPLWRCGRASSLVWWPRACRWSARSPPWPKRPTTSASTTWWPCCAPRSTRAPPLPVRCNSTRASSRTFTAPSSVRARPAAAWAWCWSAWPMTWKSARRCKPSWWARRCTRPSSRWWPSPSCCFWSLTWCRRWPACLRAPNAPCPSSPWPCWA